MMKMQIKLGKGGYHMTKEEILEKSRNENKGFDEREQQTRTMAGNISQSFGVFLCLLTAMINRYFDGPRVVSTAVLMIYVGMGASQYIVSALRLKKVSDWLMALFLTAVFVLSVLTVWELLAQGA